MFTLKRLKILTLAAGTATAVLALSAPLAANAEMTDPPACVTSPFGGCQDGPLGNGYGGTTWGPGSAFDTYSPADLASPLNGWTPYRRIDQGAMSSTDASNIRYNWGWSYCFADGTYAYCQ